MRQIFSTSVIALLSQTRGAARIDHLKIRRAVKVVKTSGMVVDLNVSNLDWVWLIIKRGDCSTQNENDLSGVSENGGSTGR